MTIAIAPPRRSWLVGQPLRTDDATRRAGGTGVLPALAQVTAGRHPLAEATLAWQCLRPRGGEAAEITRAAVRGGSTPTYLPIAYTGDDLVAGRLVRVLNGLTWAVVAGRPGDCWVGVPRGDYHRVQRALGGTWRRYRKDFTEHTTTVTDPSAAAALWRMAFLLHGRPTATNAFYLPMPVPEAADMLRRAAQILLATADTDPCARGRRSVVITNSADVRRLLTIAIA
ncbi:hypothetical protein [Micromonospora sp. WMMD1155]|uniref:hypothetical protein n=1 Tax=Micromonospora sp. WMMD1155 TaxID=3016094 RepID=UPI002499DCB7|nr:hypothetical protein [Micromonospora sp. WMMD1155]WFE48803.1 hypothetical protein O7617_00040 [Micromonospora sp. WMMD1155]WFE54955.1 hypothetical protein O7617_33365 [Micromonospora sp. WMMD1155]